MGNATPAGSRNKERAAKGTPTSSIEHGDVKRWACRSPEFPADTQNREGKREACPAGHVWVAGKLAVGVWRVNVAAAAE